MSQKKLYIRLNGDTLQQGDEIGQLPIKAQKVNILGFASHTVPFVTIQLCGCIIKAATDDV